jgi:SAM-dependent methyltransferase
MQEINFLERYQKQTARNYLARVIEHDKAESAATAKRWGADYWDGDRRYGYGGYRYDGRWRPVAVEIARHYRLAAGQRVLDVGCGKGFLLFELTQVVPGLHVAGIDISAYALAHAKPEVRRTLVRGDCAALPWADRSFDLVISLNTLHNLTPPRLKAALQDVQRVSRGASWICVESFRSEREKANLLYWQLTCESFFRPDGWKFLFDEWGYRGDYGFIYFE